MNRREFVLAASGVAGGAVAALVGTPVAAQDDGDENDDDPGDDEENGEEENGNGAANGGGTETVEVGDSYFEPEDLTIEPGTTVEWVWVGEMEHNVEPDGQPDDADWEGHPELITSGEYEYTFDVEGTYEYICTPHVAIGMVGTIEVGGDADEAAAGADVDIHDIGVPIQKHFVGVATFLAIFVSLVFTFYLLKYGESANTSSPGRKN